MPSRLKRYFEADDLHFITFSFRARRPLLEGAEARDLFLRIVEAERCKVALWIAGYVVMPEHVHVLLAKPETGAIPGWMKAVKQRFARACHREGIVAIDQVV